jgi:hypothetical protein
MRIARKRRFLREAEQAVVAKVFHDSLPPWQKILITDALGPAPWFDTPYTERAQGGLIFTINVGPLIYHDLIRGISIDAFGVDTNILIHEMTHVWQFYHGYHEALNSLCANNSKRLGFGDAYHYTVGQAWKSYSLEQQAQLVEDWYNADIGNMELTDDRFVYIDKIIRAGLDTNSAFPCLKDMLLVRMPAHELRKL